MAKDPAFLFYVNDWTGGTEHFSFAEKGAYITLLMSQFRQGSLSEFWIKRILGNNYELFWPILQEKFSQDNKGNWFNERLELEKEKRAKYKEIQAEYGKKGAEKRWGEDKGSDRVPHTDPNREPNRNPNRNPNRVNMAFEDEDVNEDITKTETKKKSTAVDKGTENFEHVERLAPSELIPEGTFEEPPELERFLYGKFGVKPERPADYSKCVRISNFSKVAELDRVRAYFEYKDSSGQIRHGLNNFLGDPPDFENGGWNNEDWPALLEAHQKQNGEAEPVDWEKI